ncbi:MAG: site-2 protease family protein [Christensenellales bacterium]
MKIKVNPLFFALALALVAFGHLLDFVWMTLCVLLHETAHALMARLRGYIPKNVVLLPYGAMMSVDESIDKKSSVLIGLAGPLANLALALATLGTWWLFPGVYPYTISFLHANLTLGVFNLLPVYPLDGSRVALGLCKNRIKTIKALRVAGVCVSVALFALFIASFFFGLNFSFGIMAVFLFYGATFGSKDETYASVLDVANKNYSLGVVKKQVSISADTPIARLYHHTSGTQDVTFSIVREGRIVAEIDEKKLKDIAVKNKLTTPVGKCLE